MHRNGVAHPWCTLFTKGSRTVTAFTSEGSKPISSLASLMAVSMSSASPSSLFPPGNETSPETQLTQLMDHLKFEPFSTRKKKKKLKKASDQSEMRGLKSAWWESHGDRHSRPGKGRWEQRLYWVCAWQIQNLNRIVEWEWNEEVCRDEALLPRFWASGPQNPSLDSK